MRAKLEPLIARLFDKEQVPVVLPKSLGLFIGTVESLFDEMAPASQEVIKASLQKEQAYVLKEIDDLRASLQETKSALGKELQQISTLAEKASSFYTIAKPERDDIARDSQADNLYELALAAGNIEVLLAPLGEQKEFKPLLAQAANLLETIETVARGDLDHKSLKPKLAEIPAEIARQSQTLTTSVETLDNLYEQELVRVVKQILAEVNASAA